MKRALSLAAAAAFAVLRMRVWGEIQAAERGPAQGRRV